jgi:hypothetical protein
MSGSIPQRARRPGKQRGTALVEATICLPILLFLMLVAGELTTVFIQHNTLTKAVRDGARHVAGNALTGAHVLNLSSTVVSEARNLVVYGNTAGSGAPLLPNLTVGAVTVTNLGSNNIEVRAQYAYSGILGAVLPTLGFGSDVSLAVGLRASGRRRAIA